MLTLNDLKDFQSYSVYLFRVTIGYIAEHGGFVKSLHMYSYDPLS